MDLVLFTLQLHKSEKSSFESILIHQRHNAFFKAMFVYKPKFMLYILYIGWTTVIH